MTVHEDDLSTVMPARRGATRARTLWVVGGDVAFARRLPDVGALRIGRATSCDIVITDSTVSREHAILTLGSEPTIRALAGRNGTRVGGTDVEPGRCVGVACGVPIELGLVLAILRPADTQAPAHAPMSTLDRFVPAVAQSTLSVLVLGETGAGKDVLARRIHQLSRRADGPFVKINCAALTESLFENELFGHEREAFTGAQRVKPGLIEAADGGTLFLDEIGELPLSCQAKLLSVIEDREVLRLGSVSPRRVDVRFVAATNRDLEAEIEHGRFRADLYHRLAGLALAVPPLRARRSEIVGLVKGFADEAARQAGCPAPHWTPEAHAILLAHDWPGNIRELRRVVEAAVLLSSSGFVGADELRIAGLANRQSCWPPVGSPPSSHGSSPSSQRHAERERIAEALARTGGNQTEAARLLGISRRTLSSRLDAYELPRPRKAHRA